MVDKSLVNVAYEILSEDYNSGNKEPKAFLQLCSEICDRIGMTEEEFMKLVSRFYTDLTLDGRFVIKENNTWTLREHELYKNVHIDMNKVYSIDEFEEDDEKKDENTDEDDEDESDSYDEEKEENNYEEDDTVESGMDDDNDENN